jgi:hypothetical protein
MIPPLTPAVVAVVVLKAGSSLDDLVELSPIKPRRGTVGRNRFRCLADL